MRSSPASAPSSIVDIAQMEPIDVAAFVKTQFKLRSNPTVK
ncbi:hypothetical protein [Granulicella sp. L60]|nr:hypothetical protein [Granulicella sp. L60]